MRLDSDHAQEVLAETWERWARRCASVCTSGRRRRAAVRAVDDPRGRGRPFSECARILRVTPMFEETAITYPVVGTTSLAVIAETAVMKVTGRGYRGARRSGGADRRRARHSPDHTAN